MRLRPLAFVAVSAAMVTALAGAGTAAAAASNRGTLTCGQQQANFTLQLSPARYVQTTELDLSSYSDDLMRTFQEPGEERLTVRDSALHLAVNPGSCTLDPQSRAHFLECPTATDDKVTIHMSGLRFTADGKSPLGTTQSTTISRELRLVSLAVHADVQTKTTLTGPQDRVIAIITVVAAIGAQSRTLHLTRDLGEWTAKKDRSDWDRCLVTP